MSEIWTPHITKGRVAKWPLTYHIHNKTTYNAYSLLQQP